MPLDANRRFPPAQGNGSTAQGNGSLGHGNGSTGHGNGSTGHGNGSTGHGNVSVGQREAVRVLTRALRATGRAAATEAAETEPGRLADKVRHLRDGNRRLPALHLHKNASVDDAPAQDPPAYSPSVPNRVASLEAHEAQLEREVRRLSRLAHTDALTGLPNQRALDDALARELARSLRQGRPLCLAALDLDHFKAVNDAFGHRRGDELLRQAAGAWRGQLRTEDVLARDHGDEFTAVLPDCRLDRAGQTIERLRAVTPDGQTVSAGVVQWDRHETAAALVARADGALYAAKQAGRNMLITAGLAG